MTWKPSVLVVAPTPSIATRVFAWLTDAGCVPLVVASFPAAKQHLDEKPSFLISEVRLGEYNGLHLALRAQGQGIPVVLIGEGDPVLQREAAQLGAVYLPRDVDAQQLLLVVEPITAAATAPVRAWQDAALPAAGANAGGVSFISVSDRARGTRQPNPIRS